MSLSDIENSASNHINGCGAQAMLILIKLSYFRSAADTDYQRVMNTDCMRMNIREFSRHLCACDTQRRPWLLQFISRHRLGPGLGSADPDTDPDAWRFVYNSRAFCCKTHSRVCRSSECFSTDRKLLKLPFTVGWCRPPSITCTWFFSGP